MTDLDAKSGRASRGSRKGSRGNVFARFFAAVGLYFRQVLDELRKVVRPTRSELWNYTLVVIVFVTVLMLIVALLDFGFARLVGVVFG